LIKYPQETIFNHNGYFIKPGVRYPMNRPVPLGTLRAFEAVGRHSHVRRAAEELCVTHSALSRQVRILEEQLGVQLFNRQNNRLSLNASGRRFLKIVQQSLAQLQEGAVHLDPESMTGELVIAVTPSISMGWLIPMVGTFNESYPEVEIHLASIEPHTRNLPGQFDLALCLSQPETEERQIRVLYQEHYLAVCKPALLKEEKPINRTSDLAKYPLLHDRFNLWQQWFLLQDEHYSGGISNIYLDHGFQCIEAARKGLGIALADQVEVAQDLREGRLVRLTDKGLPVGESIYLVTDIEPQQSVRARVFVEHMTKELNALGMIAS
jgi:LysR family glycine cleavage system transcriptional activator